MLDFSKGRGLKLVDKRDEVRKILGWVSGDTKTRPVIMDGARPYGIPNDRALMGRHLVPAAKVGKYALPTPVLSAHDEPERALAAFSESLAAYLPVTDGARTTGFLDPLDLLAEFDEGPTAGEAAHLVPVIRADARLTQALHIFANENVDWLPVVNDEGRLAGVLERREVLRAAEGGNVRQGRMDNAGERESLLVDAVSDYAETAWVQLPADAAFAKTVATLKAAGYAFVPHLRDPQTRRGSVGVVTPAYLCRSLHTHREVGGTFASVWAEQTLSERSRRS